MLLLIDKDSALFVMVSVEPTQLLSKNAPIAEDKEWLPEWDKWVQVCTPKVLNHVKLATVKVK